MAINKLIQLFIVLSLLSRFSLVSAQQQQQGNWPSYARFTSDASAFPLQADYYDYIVIGGGTAGCPLAATLSAEHRVLLLERGGAFHEFPSIHTVDGFGPTLLAGGGVDSPAQSFMSDDGVTNARGRVLGGSSAINAGFYSRAHPQFFNHESGVDWEMDLVEKAYEWVEAKVAFRPELRKWQTAVRDGLLEAAHVTPYNGFTVQHVEGTKIGASTFDSSGRRHSAAELLEFANPDNIRVATRSTVDRILFNSSNVHSSGSSQHQQQPSATGVVYRDSLGRVHHAMIRQGGEVILSAGAIGSPQLLLLSGIGPRPYLSSLNIPVAVHHPDVGQHVYDNPRNGINIITSNPLEHSLIQVVGINTTAGTFIEASSNVIPSQPRRRSRFVLPERPLYYASILEKIAGPISVGSLRLGSLDVRDNPRVRFNYLSSKVDLERCVYGMRKVGEVLEARSMEQFKMPIFGSRRYGWFGGRSRTRMGFRFMGAELPANYRVDDRAMEEFCRRTVSTIWHYHGGCVVGKVVDQDYRVTGVSNLRVIDGSTLTVSPGTNPQATLMMMGRYMGVKMNRERIDAAAKATATATRNQQRGKSDPGHSSRA